MKFENLQFTASYKERGALNKLLKLSEAEKRARGDRRHRRQPRPGSRLPRPAARRAGDHRHAARYAVREGAADPRLRRHGGDRGRRLRRGLRARHAAARGARPHLRASLRRRGRDGRPGLHRPGDARGRARPGGAAGADRRRRPDLGRRHGRQGAQPQYPRDRHRAGDVPLVHSPHARRQRPLRRPDHCRGHRGEGGGQAHLPGGATADRGRAAARGTVFRAGRGPLLQRRKDRGGGRRAPLRWGRCWRSRNASAARNAASS